MVSDTAFWFVPILIGNILVIDIRFFIIEAPHDLPVQCTLTNIAFIECFVLKIIHEIDCIS